MKKIVLHDIFIGEFPVTQVYGANPEYYGKFGLDGHEGIDWGMPNMTKLICPFKEAIVVRKEISAYGAYGKHTALWDPVQKAAVWFCHCHTIECEVGDVLYKGNLVAYSNNTGNSTGPHLHMNICKTDSNGIRTNQDNGYMGMLDPNKVVDWKIENPSEPTKGEPMGDSPKKDVCISKDKFEELVHKSSIRDEFKKGGFDNIGQVVTLIQELRENIKSERDLKSIEKARGDELRKELNEFIGTVANESHLNCVQEKVEILAEASKAGKNAMELEDLQRAFGAYKEEVAKTETELRAEIARLKEMLSLEKSELLKAVILDIIEKLKAIIRR